MIGRATIDRQTIHHADIVALVDTEYPDARAHQQKFGFRAILAVPLMREDRAIGGIVLWRTEARAFTDKQVALVKTFADQAAIAIENVRLFNETKESLEQQTAISEVLRVISSSPGVMAADARRRRERAPEVCDAAESTIVLSRGQPRAVATFGGTPTLNEGELMPLTRGSAGGARGHRPRRIRMRTWRRRRRMNFIGLEPQRRFHHHAILRCR